MVINGLSPLAPASAGLSGAQPGPTQTGGLSFEAALGNVIGGAVGALQAGETAAIEGLKGAASPMKVVESVMEAQRSLQTVLSIRDKIVSAWQDVSHMAI